MRRAWIFVFLALAAIGLLLFAYDLAPAWDPASSTERAPGADASSANTPSKHSDAPQPEEERISTAPREDEGPADGRLVVRVVWHDGSPAPDIAVRCRALYPRLLPGGTRLAVSDEAGVAVFEGLGTRALSLRSFRGGDAKAESIAGRETEAVLKLETGHDVLGRVVDPSGAPVADAKIWMTTGWRNWLGGRFVARSDAEGAFRVRAVEAGQSLGAVHPRFSRSPLVDLDMQDTSVSPVALRLELGSGGATLRVRVVGIAREAVAGARVAVGEMPRDFETRSTRRGGWAQKEAWTPQCVETDANGVALAHGLPEGTRPVVVRADGAAIWKGSADLRAGQTSELRVTLTRGVTVYGRVSDGFGKPVDGAVVRAIDAEFDESFLQSGQFDYESVLDYPMAVCDAAGRYRIENIAAGTIYLHAQMPRRKPRREVLYRAKHVLQATDGRDFEWSPRLEPGATIEGKVTYRCGTAMPNVFLTAKNVETGKSHVIVSGPDGEFRFVNLMPVPHDVSVQLRAAPKGAKPVGAERVQPGQARLDLRADYDAPIRKAPGSVVGRFEDPGKRVANATALSVMLVSDKRSWRNCHDFEADGAGTRFRFSGIPPGRYRLTAKSHEDVIYAGAWFEVHPGAKHDAGTLRTGAAGSARFRLRRAPGTENCKVRLYVRAPGVKIHATEIDVGTRSEVLHENLPLGTCTLGAYASGAERIQNVEFKTTRGVPADVELELRPRYFVTVHLPLEGTKPEDTVQLEAFDLQGKPLHKQDYGQLAKLPQRSRVWFQTPRPGRLVLVARIGSKRLRAECDVAMDASKKCEARLR